MCHLLLGHITMAVRNLDAGDDGGAGGRALASGAGSCASQVQLSGLTKEASDQRLVRGILALSLAA